MHSLCVWHKPICVAQSCYFVVIVIVVTLNSTPHCRFLGKPNVDYPLVWQHIFSYGWTLTSSDKQIKKVLSRAGNCRSQAENGKGKARESVKPPTQQWVLCTKISPACFVRVWKYKTFFTIEMCEAPHQVTNDSLWLIMFWILSRNAAFSWKHLAK